MNTITKWKEMYRFQVCAKSGRDDRTVIKWLDEVMHATQFDDLSSSGRDMEILDAKICDSLSQAAANASDQRIPYSVFHLRESENISLNLWHSSP